MAKQRIEGVVAYITSLDKMISLFNMVHLVLLYKTC